MRGDKGAQQFSGLRSKMNLNANNEKAWPFRGLHVRICKIATLQVE